MIYSCVTNRRHWIQIAYKLKIEQNGVTKMKSVETAQTCFFKKANLSCKSGSFFWVLPSCLHVTNFPINIIRLDRLNILRSGQTYLTR